jgi:hypothetical protein
MEILKMGEETLREVSSPVSCINEDIKDLLDEMFITLERSNGIGLAAPQVGKNIRLFIVKLEEDNGMVFINPEIIRTSDEQCSMEEGCLSIPKVYEKVIRPKDVTVQYMGINGKKQLIQATGLLARVIQHEYDHLNGVLFVDRLEEEAKEKAIGKFKKLYGKKKQRS